MTETVSTGRANPSTRLRKLAANPRIAGRAPQLRALAEALDTESDPVEGVLGVERWAGLDLFAAFLQEDTVGSPTGLRRWLGPLVDIMIQVLFFVPIAITWLGLMLATLAYESASRLKAFAGTSFLAGWQSGFADKLPKVFYLDRVALYVVIVIALLIILMIVQFCYSGKPPEDERVRLYRDLADVLTETELRLAPLRVSAPAEAAAALHRATTEFTKTAATIRSVGETAHRVQREAIGSLEALVTAMGRAESLSTSMLASAEGIGESSRTLGERLTEISMTTSAIAAAEVELVRQIGVSSDRLSSSMDMMIHRFQDAVVANQVDVSTAVDSSASKISSALAAGADRVKGALAEIQSTACAYTRRVELAADTLGKADTTIQEIPQVISELRPRIADLGDRIAELERAIAVAKTAVSRDSDFPANIRDVLGDLRTAASELRAASEALRTAPPRKPWSPRKRRMMPPWRSTR